MQLLIALGPDYTNANLVGSVADNLSTIDYNPIGSYLTYRPLDRDYYTNKLNAQAEATRRAIVDQSGGNRATATAGILAADYNAQNRLGDLARQAEEYNMAQRERVEAFNRGTNQFNSELAMRAAMANQQNNELRLRARSTQAPRCLSAVLYRARRLSASPARPFLPKTAQLARFLATTSTFTT